MREMTVGVEARIEVGRRLAEFAEAEMHIVQERIQLRLADIWVGSQIISRVELGDRGVGSEAAREIMR